MKNFISLTIVSFLLLILISNKILAQWGDGPELVIANKTGSSGYNINIKIFPVGAVYNFLQQYSPRIVGDPLPNNGPIYLVGFNSTLRNTIDSTSRAFGQFDGLGQATQCVFGFGIGLYKLEFYAEGTTELLNYCYIDWRDANVYLNPAYPTTDLAIYYYNQDSINFFWNVSGSNPPLNINAVNKYIKLWEFKGSPLDTLKLVPSKGIFNLDVTNNGEFLKLPINYNLYNGNIGHENPGDIGMNLLINHNVTTRDTLIDTITNINITNKSVLTILANDTLDLITPVSPPAGHTNVTVEDSSGLSLLNNSKIIIRDRNKLTLRQNSFVKSYPGSEITVHPGGTFCNEGSDIVGPLKIHFLSGIFPVCAITSAFEIKDSTSIVLSDSAVLELPDDYTLHISGKESSLILNPHSKIKFGENSKIIIDSSATLIANGETFTSLDSNQKWDGIILNNSGADTITNCMFSNAVTASMGNFI